MDVEGNLQDLLYRPFEARSFTNNLCFLCGTILNEQNRTDEHIFPRWLQRRYDLRHERYNLINGTQIPFRQLTVPCCFNCNNRKLRPLEDAISNAVAKGYTAFSQLDQLTIYQWIAKIFYGMLFKELSMLKDRRNPSAGYILSEEKLRRYANLHDFLQSVRVPFEFINFKPWSIFVFKTHSYSDRRDFEYRRAQHEIGMLVMSIRMNGIGVIVCLEDFGRQQSDFSEYYAQFDGITLHPLQFAELSAIAMYHNARTIHQPYEIIFQPNNGKIEVIFYHKEMDLTLPPYYEHDQGVFAEILAMNWQNYSVTLDDIYKRDKVTKSALFDDDGNIMIRDANGCKIGIRPRSR